MPQDLRRVRAPPSAPPSPPPPPPSPQSPVDECATFNDKLKPKKCKGCTTKKKCKKAKCVNCEKTCCQNGFPPAS